MLRLILLSITVFITFNADAQFFNAKPESKFLSENERKTVYLQEINNAINSSFEDFKNQIQELAKWEVDQYRRVLLEIEGEIKGLPPQKVEEIKNLKMAELTLLLADMEAELDFEYAQLIGILNRVNKAYTVNFEFEPMIKIEGRLQTKILEIALFSNKMESKNENIKTAVQVGLFAAEFPLKIAFLPGFALSFVIDETADKLLNELLPNVDENLLMRVIDYTDGMLVHNQVTFKEIIESI